MTFPLLTTVTLNEYSAALGAMNCEIWFRPATGLYDAAGNPVIVPITDPADQIIINMSPVPVTVNRGQGSVDLVPTDTAGLSPAGWMYAVTTKIPGIPDYSNLYYIPSSPDPVDLSELTPLVSPTAANLTPYMPLTGGQFSGPVESAVVTLTGSGTIPVNAAAGNVFRVTLTGDATLGDPSGGTDTQAIRFDITPDGHTLGYGGAYNFGDAGEPSLNLARRNTLGFAYNADAGSWDSYGGATGF